MRALEDTATNYDETLVCEGDTKYGGTFIVGKIAFRGLPFTQTSDIYPKKKYKRHLYPYRVIDYGLRLLEHGYGPIVIARKINLRYGLNINSVTIWKWQRKFRPETIRGKLGSKHHDEWKRNISMGMAAFCMHAGSPNSRGAGKHKKGTALSNT